MLFFKPKQKPDDFIPPPPPGQLMEESAKEPLTEKPKFFDKLVKQKPNIREEKELKDKTLNSKKVLGKGKAIKNIPKSELPKLKAEATKKIQDNQQVKKEEAKQKNPVQAKKKIKPRIPAKKIKQPANNALEPDLKDIELDDMSFEMHDFDGKNNMLPQELEDFDIDNFGSELAQKAEKPIEITEAQEEIQSAIEKIKKPSFFNKLFAKREKLEKPTNAYQAQNDSGVSAIQSNIKMAKAALTKFDLEAAKKSYIEIIRMYNKLNPQDKAKVYHEINDLYSERKSAEELKV